MFSNWLAPLRSLFRRGATERDMDAELRAHIQSRADDLERSGLPRAEAERRARMEFGGYQKFKEECRDAGSAHFFDTLLKDIRYALRILRRSPGFSILVILCLTLGIGANAAVFSWIEGLLVRPYPAVSHQDRMYALVGSAPSDPDNPDLSWPDFLDLQRNCKLVEAFIADEITGAALNIGGRAERATGSIVSANYFDALGVRPILGRGFKPGEDAGRNAHPVAVISYQMWQDRYNADPQIIGKPQRFNNVQFTIVGVTPKNFYGTFVGRSIQFWVPASMVQVLNGNNYPLDDRSAHWIEGFVKLKPGVTRAQAQAEISSMTARLASIYPETDRGRDVKILPLWLTPFNHAGELRPTLEIMMAVVAFVLLIVCANVGNLLLVRFFLRRHEMMVRLALGAPRLRLVRQLLTESVILSAFAAVGGLLVAYWCRNALVLFYPRSGFLAYLPGEIDWRVLTLSIGVCVLATLLFGLIPATQASKLDLAAALKSEMGGLVSGQSRSRLRSGLVLVQVSLSFVLLVGAGLLLRSLRAMQNSNLGFSTHDVLFTYVDLFGSGYDAQRAESFQKQLIARLQSLPGIESVAGSSFVPLDLAPPSSGVIKVDGYVPPPNQQPIVEYDKVSPRYFSTVGISLISGREFTPADDKNAALVAIVNEQMVRQFWNGKDPIGERLQVNGLSMHVIGIAETSKYLYVSEPPRPFFFVPLLQNPDSTAYLNIRTSMPARSVASILTNELRAIDSGLASGALVSMQEQVNRSTAAQRAAVGMLFVLGGLALALATIGLYGVLSYSVSQSRRELGLRMTLGASSSNLLWYVLSRSLTLTIFGVALGAAVALVAARFATDLLYHVSPRDPLAFTLAFVIMMVASLAACFVPAWRASRTDPMVALRYE
ncbi:MAG TPA: ABC transporter permease [Candidatus Acidoferrales bacterium]|nr:ABC transporter permease [Candidatus Acidoferrales bacterium]